MTNLVGLSCLEQNTHVSEDIQSILAQMEADQVAEITEWPSCSILRQCFAAESVLVTLLVDGAWIDPEP